MTGELFDVQGTPDIPGLRFRGFRGSEDYPLMHEVIAASKKADKDDEYESVEDIARQYRHITNCDPFKDMLFAEVDCKVIGYTRSFFTRKLGKGYNYHHFVVLVPEWRGKGIRRAMLLWNENRLREAARDHPKDVERVLWVWGSEDEKDWLSLVTSEGYEPIRYSFLMVRPDLENIPDLPLPEGIGVRPTKPEHYRKIWVADWEACKDDWEPVEWEDEWLESWKESRLFQPELWQVAWAGDKVAGAVQSFIDGEENKEYGRKRGYTENIHVGREWRRQGLAKALIARSLKLIKDKGMEEAALGVDSENPTGALHVYESLGFRKVKEWITYTKPLD